MVSLVPPETTLSVSLVCPADTCLRSLAEVLAALAGLQRRAREEIETAADVAPSVSGSEDPLVFDAHLLEYGAEVSAAVVDPHRRDDVSFGHHHIADDRSDFCGCASGRALVVTIGHDERSSSTSDSLVPKLESLRHH